MQYAGKQHAEKQGAAPRQASSLALVVICVGYFMVIVGTTVVNVALPAIGRDLQGGVAGRQRVVDAHTLSFAGLLLTGALAERLGGRPVLGAGLAVFAAASAACGLAPTLGTLVAARLVQGAGASSQPGGNPAGALHRPGAGGVHLDVVGHALVYQPGL